MACRFLARTICVQATHGAALHGDLRIPHAQLILRKGFRPESIPIRPFSRMTGRRRRDLAAICASADFNAFSSPASLSTFACAIRPRTRKLRASRRMWSMTPAARLTSKDRSRPRAEASPNAASKRGRPGLSPRWPMSSTEALCDANHFHLQPDQDLRLRLPGAEDDRPRDPPRRDLRAARPERRRQDDADQHRLRHRQPELAARCSPTATTSCATIAPRAAKIGLVPQELTTDAFETRLGHGQLQPRPVRQAARPGAISRRCCASCRCGTRRTARS